MRLGPLGPLALSLSLVTPSALPSLKRPADITPPFGSSLTRASGKFRVPVLGLLALHSLVPVPSSCSVRWLYGRGRSIYYIRVKGQSHMFIRSLLGAPVYLRGFLWGSGDYLSSLQGYSRSM